MRMVIDMEFDGPDPSRAVGRVVVTLDEHTTLVVLSDASCTIRSNGYDDILQIQITGRMDHEQERRGALAQADSDSRIPAVECAGTRAAIPCAPAAGECDFDRNTEGDQ